LISDINFSTPIIHWLFYERNSYSSIQLLENKSLDMIGRVSDFFFPQIFLILKLETFIQILFFKFWLCHQFCLQVSYVKENVEPSLWIIVVSQD
jgi:hypothetical protein